MEEITETLDETFARWEEEAKARKISYWINNHIPGYAGYNAWYILRHPWEILFEWKRQIVWAWQRVFRGWDDRVIWSIDGYLNEKLPVWIMQLKEDKQGMPSLCFDPEEWNSDANEFSDEGWEKAEEKWDNVLDQIADGFKANQRINDESLWKKDPEYEVLKNKFENALDLLKVYYNCLWD